MLDNGYVYLAATRLSLFRSSREWAMVIEVFGSHPRTGQPDLTVSTFASSLARSPASSYLTPEAHQDYLRKHPHDDSRHFFPIDDGPWMDEESMFIAREQGLELVVRGRTLSLPSRDEYARVGIDLANSERVHVFEASRYVAAIAREQVLATVSEQRVSVLSDMERLLVLDEWNHPDLAADERPSELESFKQLAEVLSSGDVGKYRPVAPPNTHWKNWPDGGTL